ncbi:MAG: response regulator transcription factor [Tissierellia bacterium]|nr:response regulator transcription factor [Tissierellia bacterium]
MSDSILIVDGDKIFAESLRYSFEKDNYIIDILNNGSRLAEKLKNNDYKLLLLDPQSPGIEGVEICKKIRRITKIPLIIISANNDDMNKILALDYGADDYLVKPFNVLELKARIKSIFRRIDDKSDRDKYLVKIDDFSIDALRRKIFFRDSDLNLTGKEFDLFYVLSSCPGKVFSREELLKKIWGYEYYGDLRTVDVHIRRIREKIEKVSASDKLYISTKWGVGYFFKEK